MGKKTSIEKNSIIRVTIDDITDLGFGVGRVDGKVIFIADTVPGDVCDVKIIKDNSSYYVGRVEKLIEASIEREENTCCGNCKSCAYRLISYENECARKEDGVRRLFSSDELKGIVTEPIIKSPSAERYRNKAQYPIAKKGDDYLVGFYAPKSHRVTPVDDCPLTPVVFSQIVKDLKVFFAKSNLSVYDEESGKGLLRHIYLRKAAVSGEILLTLVINGDKIPGMSTFAENLVSKYPDIVGVLINVNKEKTNVVLGDKFITVFGRDYIYDTLAGVELKITAPSFYQVNHDCAELLYAKARELASAGKDDTLLDLYCGAGSIGLSMAKDAGEVIGIEIVESAVKCANENALCNSISNARFFTGDAANTENLLAIAEKELGHKIKPDVVILDPPRAGCDENLIDYVSSLQPKKIVYISCNPKTLARDIVKFRANGFDTNAVTPVDMFPRTGHVESLVCLERKEK